MSTLEARLKRILVEQLDYPLDPDSLGEDTLLWGKGLGLHSMDRLTLLVRLEAEFEVCFEDDEAGNGLATFGALVRLLQRKLGDVPGPRQGHGGA